VNIDVEIIMENLTQALFETSILSHGAIMSSVSSAIEYFVHIRFSKLKVIQNLPTSTLHSEMQHLQVSMQFIV
jgi:hypothetical protein